MIQDDTLNNKINKIKKVGSIQKLDKEGYVINNLSLGNIQEEYKNIIDDTIAFYNTKFKNDIHSIYLRGSVAKGKAIPFISDIDTLAISFREIEKKELFNHIYFWDEMDAKHDILNGVEIHFESLDKVRSSQKTQFLLKTQCICIQGEDLRPKIQNFGIGEWAYVHSNNIEHGITQVETWLKGENTHEEFKEICSWIMKRTVRIGFELVMEQEQCFTRDLYPCHEIFSKYYPKKSEAMKAALALAVFPTSDMNLMWSVLHDIHDFLVDKVEKRNKN